MNAVQLSLSYDVEKMKADLAVVEQFWKRHRSYESPTEFTVKKDDAWVIIGLISPGGDLDRTDPGGPGLFEYKETIALDETPYFRAILDELTNQYGAVLTCVRFSGLNPGASIHEHCDVGFDFRFSKIRLHIPIIVDPQIEFIVGGDKIHMTPGHLWYANFSLPHRLHNPSTVRRVHLIIDVVIGDQILSVFPKEMIAAIGKDNILISRKKHHVSKLALKNYECDFSFHFILMERVLGLPKNLTTFIAKIRLQDDQLILNLNDEPYLALVPVSDTDFYFLGGNETYYMTFSLKNDVVEKVSIVLKEGKLKTLIELPLIQ